MIKVRELQLGDVLRIQQPYTNESVMLASGREVYVVRIALNTVTLAFKQTPRFNNNKDISHVLFSCGGFKKCIDFNTDILTKVKLVERGGIRVSW